MDSPAATSHPLDPYAPRELDVVLGRGRNIESRPGNRAFQGIVRRFLGAYRDAVTRKEKKQVTLDVIREASRFGVRFLRFEEGAWREADTETVRVRVGQSLRYMLKNAMQMDQENGAVPHEASLSLPSPFTQADLYSQGSFREEHFAPVHQTRSQVEASSSHFPSHRPSVTQTNTSHLSQASSSIALIPNIPTRFNVPPVISTKRGNRRKRRLSARSESSSSSWTVPHSNIRHKPARRESNTCSVSTVDHFLATTTADMAAEYEGDPLRFSEHEFSFSKDEEDDDEEGKKKVAV